MKKILITSPPNTQDICSCMLPSGSSLLCEGIHSDSSPEKKKSIARMTDGLNVKEEKVAIHHAFTQHACFCSIIPSWGKDSDASRKQTSQEMICEIQTDRDKGSGGLVEGNKEMQAEMKLTFLKEVFLCI